MKRIHPLLLGILLAACSPAAQPVTRVPDTTAPEIQTATVPLNPTERALPPTATPQPTQTPQPSPTPFTAPVTIASHTMDMSDGLGYGTVLLALSDGTAWETTSQGGLRVYDSADWSIRERFDLKAQGKPFTRLVADDKYVWALFYAFFSPGDPARLFRVDRTDLSVEALELPADCTYDLCNWSYLLPDEDILWVGGYDELWGFQRDSFEKVTSYLFSEQAHTFFPGQISDVDVTADGQIWTLFCVDSCYIIVLDRQKLLDGVDQEAASIDFVNSTIQFVARARDSMWAADSEGGGSEAAPAIFYRLDETGVLLSPEDGITLPENLEFLALASSPYLDDGRYLWVLDTRGRKLFWFDPQTASVAGVFQAFPGDEPDANDPRRLHSISFDGTYLWAGGVETLQIALPWVK